MIINIYRVIPLKFAEFNNNGGQAGKASAAVFLDDKQVVRWNKCTGTTKR